MCYYVILVLTLCHRTHLFDWRVFSLINFTMKVLLHIKSQSVSSNGQKGFKTELRASSLESCQFWTLEKPPSSSWVTSVMLAQSKAANPERPVSHLPCRIHLGGKRWARRLWSLCVPPGPPALCPLCPRSAPPLWILLPLATSWSWRCASWCLNTGR